MTASASESIIARLIDAMDGRDFWQCWAPAGDAFLFQPTGETFNRVWASYVFGLTAREGEVFE